MGYSHYLESDENLGAERARRCGEACLDFLEKVPGFVLEELLEPPERLRQEGAEGLASMNEAILARDRTAAREAMEKHWQGGFAVQPRRMESFAVHPDRSFESCKTGGPAMPADPLAVCLHLACQEALREGRNRPLRFRSDGDTACMALAEAFWRRCTGRKAPSMPFINAPKPRPSAVPEAEAPARLKPSVKPGLDSMFEAAQCIWEEVLPETDPGRRFGEAADEFGMDGLRERLRDPELLEACCRGWQTAEESMNGASFSRGYVPVFVEECIDADAAELKSDWEQRLAAVLAEEEAPRP